MQWHVQVTLIKEGAMKAPGVALAELAAMPTPAMADSPAKSIPALTRQSPSTEQLPTQKVFLGN